ncbi:MBL fold metallo-hydrolase [Paucibacter sp. AS339]|uniref:MBL fold metallo-hydrolase n=1 Tax=Paucibacter hankyongi TaxID=3133434 RepID=UPI0030AF5E2F
MKITQLRSATLKIQLGAHCILVDPMLAPRHALPPLRLLDGVRERNPTCDLPGAVDGLLQDVSHALITHCRKGHFDHLDRAGKAWLRQHQTSVICTPHDAEHLRSRGLNVQPLPSEHHRPQPFLAGQIRTVRCTHGKGAVRLLMEHGVGYFIELPGEPSVYLAGDTVLTPAVQDFVREQQPDVSVIPAGGARFDLGQELIMDVAEVLAFCRLAKGAVVANHLEALSHCPVTRAELRLAAEAAGLAERLFVPEDGESLQFSRAARSLQPITTASHPC